MTNTLKGLLVFAVVMSISYLLVGCTTEDAFEASTGETPAEFIERQCKENMLDCERVYAFEAYADNPLGRVELCVRKDDLGIAEGLYGASELSPDPRFDQWKLLGVEPVCWWQCPSMKGCNAYGGAVGQGSCFCPAVQ